jgi:ABC-type branched-subunit amino acid transport system substrate-binding protein
VRALYEQNGAKSVWSGVVSGNLDGAAAPFVREYEARFGGKLRTESAFAYDDIFVLSEALNACAPEIATGCVTNALTATNDDGVAGRLTFNPQRQSNRESFMMRAHGGEGRKLAHLAPIPLP